jgi:hypothetical protein
MTQIIIPYGSDAISIQFNADGSAISEGSPVPEGSLGLASISGRVSFLNITPLTIGTLPAGARPLLFMVYTKIAEVGAPDQYWFDIGIEGDQDYFLAGQAEVTPITAALNGMMIIPNGDIPIAHMTDEIDEDTDVTVTFAEDVGGGSPISALTIDVVLWYQSPA